MEIKTVQDLLNYPKVHDFMAEELLVPNMDKVESNRGLMWGSHFSQHVNLIYPELPRVYTRFEDQFGLYSDLGFYDAEKDFIVIDKIKKNENVYFMIIQYKETGQYHIIERRNEFWLTEKYGFTFNNGIIDSKKKGDVVNKGERLWKTSSYDENDNYMYGKNLNTAFYTMKCMTLEDAMVISRSASKAMSSYKVEKIKVVINNNDLLLNLNTENNGVYKCFPSINEEVENFLAVRRRLAYKNLYNFDDLSLKSLNPDDEKIYGHGKVIDIDIYSNIEEKDLEGIYNKQLKNLLRKRKTFNREFVKVVEPLVTNHFEKCSGELIQEYNKIAMEINKVPFSNENSVFSGIVLEFTMLAENPVNVGSKISGRYGNKGVVSHIIEDEDMPRIKSGPRKGELIDIILNPLGVPNRVNPSQLFEHELNFCAKFIQDKMKVMEFEDARDLYFEFKSMVNEKETEFELEFFNELDEDQQFEYLEECEKEIYFHQEPFWNEMNLNRLSAIYEKYDFIKPYEIDDPLDGINIPLVVSPMFFVRLKHEAKGKFSARSTSHENLKNAPAKTKAYKYHKSAYSMTPIKIGSMELLNLLLTSNPDAVNKLLSSYSTNEEAKDDILLQLLTGDPFNTAIDLVLDDEAETKKMIDSLFYNLALEFEEVES